MVSQSERYWKERAQSAEAQLLQQQTDPKGPAWERIQADVVRLRQEREALRLEVQEAKTKQLEAEARHERWVVWFSMLSDDYLFGLVQFCSFDLFFAVLLVPAG